MAAYTLPVKATLLLRRTMGFLERRWPAGRRKSDLSHVAIVTCGIPMGILIVWLDRVVRQLNSNFEIRNSKLETRRKFETRSPKSKLSCRLDRLPRFPRSFLPLDSPSAFLEFRFAAMSTVGSTHPGSSLDLTQHSAFDF